MIALIINDNNRGPFMALFLTMAILFVLALLKIIDNYRYSPRGVEKWIAIWNKRNQSIIRRSEVRERLVNNKIDGQDNWEFMEESEPPRHGAKEVKYFLNEEGDIEVRHE